MGTNYYLKIVPSKKRKKELYDAIEADDFSLINRLKVEMYDPIQLDDDNNIIGGKVHLGKRSGGWKFLWNPNVFQVRNGHSELIDNPDGSRSSRWIPEPDTAKYLYPLTKKGIKAFIDREDVEIWDEYGEKQDKEEFWKMALEWVTWNGEEAWDSDTYHQEHLEARKWSYRNEYTDFLEDLGYKLSEDKSDFYSDGLRFATCTEFS